MDPTTVFVKGLGRERRAVVTPTMATTHAGGGGFLMAIGMRSA
jgi:hypothetical protein